MVDYFRLRADLVDYLSLAAREVVDYLGLDANSLVDYLSDLKKYILAFKKSRRIFFDLDNVVDYFFDLDDVVDYLVGQFGPAPRLCGFVGLPDLDEGSVGRA